MGLVKSISSWVLSQRLRRIDDIRKNAGDIQDKIFRGLVRSLSQTRFAAESSLDLSSETSQFRKKIPVRTYEEFYPWIERTLKGEPDVLWPGVIRWFSKSSGTTNAKRPTVELIKKLERIAPNNPSQFVVSSDFC